MANRDRPGHEQKRKVKGDPEPQVKVLVRQQLFIEIAGLRKDLTTYEEAGWVRAEAVHQEGTKHKPGSRQRWIGPQGLGMFLVSDQALTVHDPDLWVPLQRLRLNAQLFREPHVVVI